MTEEKKSNEVFGEKQREGKERTAEGEVGGMVVG